MRTATIAPSAHGAHGVVVIVCITGLDVVVEPQGCDRFRTGLLQRAEVPADRVQQFRMAGEVGAPVDVPVPYDG